ncbi:PREDICTED: cell cycle checkpoint control protein RAD9A [Dufourea novaeangliae]|uniref:Cell cycle checkpoint control protein n=1 Tax=Dufourea novaeangliae TaxID=178035 RepID=A0A154PCY9_DUFNO|nr:PREDICTED: cell cycle checkpoint control protein RAD9A [Dufourea novaeangliae]KZC09657.1 Cell cycle checkpoint control protein RAD9A [Dufourea novaeangliae]
MKCVIPGANIKILAKAIHALAKIGEEMFIEPQSDAISFRTVNMANSAYADFTFCQTYFSYYAYGDLQEDDALKCKISMRSAMAVFKAPNLIDKQVETCHIRLEPDASEIIFILKYKNSIIKTHLLPILDCEKLQTDYDKDSAKNQLSSQGRVFGDAMLNFHQHLIEITFEVSSQKLLLRNYVDDASGLSNTTRTQVALGKGEFDKFDINSDTSITFCMKEFKAFLNFSETVGIPLSMFFEQAGKPVIFALKNPSFEGKLILSTLSSDADSQTETTIVGRQDKSVKRKAGSKQNSRRPNKSKSKIKHRSINDNKTGSSTVKDIHSYLMEKEKETNENISKVNDNFQPNTSNSSMRNNQNKNDISYSLDEQNNQKEFHSNQHGSHNNPSSSSNTSDKFTRASTSGRKLVNSVFSTITKRKSTNFEADMQEREKSDQSDTLEDAVPSSPPPPAKRARLIFQKCFQKTFDPTTLPGYDIILAEDSDENCSD